MIFYVNTDLFESPAQVIVNTVNTVGVMGKGIAKRFKDVYPEMFKEYQKLCESGKLTPGRLWVYKTSNKWVLNFPTKKHWKSPSKVEYIENGLKKFVDTYYEKGITSISFPLLGCGNGGLDWESVVQPLMEKYLRGLPIDIYIHLPPRLDFKIEHNHILETKKWLRSVPTSLSYFEVWEDITEKYNGIKNELYTATGNGFLLTISEECDGRSVMKIMIMDKNEYFEINREQFADFWNYLRSVGFCLVQELPSGLKEIGNYLFTLLVTLDYIEPVNIAHRYTNNDDMHVGIRLIPYYASTRTENTFGEEVVSAE